MVRGHSIVSRVINSFPRHSKSCERYNNSFQRLSKTWKYIVTRDDDKVSRWNDIITGEIFHMSLPGLVQQLFEAHQLFSILTVYVFICNSISLPC